MANLSGDLAKYNMAEAYLTGITVKGKLMISGFTFNRTTQEKWSDISASELTNAHGYTTGGVTLAGITITKDTVSKKVTVTWNNPQWTASGGDIGPIAGLAVINDTSTDKDIMGYIPCVPEQIQPNGGVFTFADVGFDIVDTVTPV